MPVLTASIAVLLTLAGGAALAAPDAPVEHPFIAEIRADLVPQLRPRERARLAAARATPAPGY